MYNLILTIVFVVAMAISSGLAFKWSAWTPSRRQAVWFGAVWVVAATLEFWALGPYSFIGLAEDLDETMVLALSQRLSHGQFSHALAGGVDLAATAINVGASLSLEGLLVGYLPLWAAISAHKLLLFLASFSGMYLLSRRGAGASRLASLAVAALFSHSQDRLVEMTMVHGLGFALVPMAVLVCAMGRRHWLAILAVAAVNAVSSSPTHSNLVLFATVAWGGLMLGGWRGALRAFPPLAIFAVLLLGNWGDSLLAKVLIGSLSARGDGYAVFDEPLRGIVESLVTMGRNFRPTWAALVIGAGLGVVYGGRSRYRAPAIVAVSLVTGSLLQLMPWQGLGLGQLKGLHFTNMNYAAIPLAHLTLALGLSFASASTLRWGRMAVSAVLGLAVGQFAWFKVQHGATLLSLGGQGTVLAAQRALDQPSWRPTEPSRLVSIPYRLPINAPVMWGADIMDGAGIHVPLRSLAHMWQYGVIRDPRSLDMVSGFIPMAVPLEVLKCAEQLDLDAYFDTGFLRLANVGHVLSVVPLTGKGLVQVAGPQGAAPIRCGASSAERISAYLHYVMNPPEVRVYALAPPMPRVYAARLIVVPAAAEEPLDRLRNGGGLEGLAQIAASDAVGLQSGAQDLSVTGFTLVQDGIDVTVAAPHGGVVVINDGYLPFWAATADGRAATVMPVNGFQMGVVVPAGARVVHLRYHRPTLSEKLAGHQSEGN